MLKNADKPAGNPFLVNEINPFPSNVPPFIIPITRSLNKLVIPVAKPMISFLIKIKDTLAPPFNIPVLLNSMRIIIKNNTNTITIIKGLNHSLISGKLEIP